MDGDSDFDLIPHGIDFFSGDQNALDAPQPDLSFELLYPDIEALFFANKLVNFDRSNLPNEVNICYKDSTSLESKPCLGVHDEIAAYTQELTEDYSESTVTPSPWESEVAALRCTRGQRLVCHYGGCTSTPFRTTCDLKVHLKCHLFELLNQWVDGQNQHCMWPHCTSKATFKSKKALQTHLENIHIDPLLCPERDCTYRMPFRSNYDLKRHVRTVHYGDNELQYHCPFPQCRDFPRTFVRKDKWLNHLRSGHDGSTCPLSHCESGTADTQAKLVEHIKNSHGNFECGIGSCYQQPPSRFAKFGLMKHLEFEHGIQHGDINIAQNAAIQARDRTVKSENLPRTASWTNCQLCLARSDIREDREKRGCLPRSEG